MIDAHCHISFKQFNRDRDEVIERSRGRLEAVVDCAVTAGTIERSLEMSERYDIIHSTAGVHPYKAGRMTQEAVNEVLGVITANMERIVAIGEAGLEYHHTDDKAEHQRQKEVFGQVIDLAKEHGMPLVIHARDAEAEALEMVQKAGLEKVLFHCYGGDVGTARGIIDNGYNISFATNVCYSEHHQSLVEDISLDNILLETDSPYLSPVKTNKRNEPLHVLESVKKVADIKGVQEKEVEAAVTASAMDFYGL